MINLKVKEINKSENQDRFVKILNTRKNKETQT